MVILKDYFWTVKMCFKIGGRCCEAALSCGLFLVALWILPLRGMTEQTEQTGQTE